LRNQLTNRERKDTMLEKDFLMAVAERAIKTFAQTVIAMVGTNAMGAFDSTFVNALEVGLVAAIMSVITSYASATSGRKGPSLAGESIHPDLQITVAAPAPEKKKAAAKKAPAAKKATTKK
jgi:putative AlgH/UPF0301 family transcriptional regulator